MSSYTERFQAYFTREIAQKAAKSIADGAEMEFRITDGESAAETSIETFVFTKTAGRNGIRSGRSTDPHLVFTLTATAADSVLTDPANEIGTIGVNILKLIVSSKDGHRVSVKLNAGFLTLFSKGYFGVITAGGGEFASYLGGIGLSGMGAIKSAIKKLKG